MKNNIHNKINKRNRKQLLKNVSKHSRGMIKKISYDIYKNAMDANKEYVYHEWVNKIMLPVEY